MRDDVPSGLAESEPTARDAAVVGAALARAAPDAGPPPTGGPWSRWVQRTTGGAALYPLAVLFGLNMVDELDRTAFGVLTPEIRDYFDLACVFAQQPTVVLLDEPSSGIAQREAEALAPLLRRVRDELGASLLVIEHDLPLLTSIADRMIALDLGRIVVMGDPIDVIEHPAVVASYLGADEAAIARSGDQVPPVTIETAGP